MVDKCYESLISPFPVKFVSLLHFKTCFVGHYGYTTEEKQWGTNPLLQYIKFRMKAFLAKVTLVCFICQTSIHKTMEKKFRCFFLSFVFSFFFLQHRILVCNITLHWFSLIFITSISDHYKKNETFFVEDNSRYLDFEMKVGGEKNKKLGQQKFLKKIEKKQPKSNTFSFLFL